MKKWEKMSFQHIKYKAHKHTTQNIQNDKIINFHKGRSCNANSLRNYVLQYPNIDPHPWIYIGHMSGVLCWLWCPTYDVGRSTRVKRNECMLYASSIVFPLPCSPTNMMILGFPFTGCHTGTPGSSSLHSSLKTEVWMIRRLFRRAAISLKSMAALREGE